MLEAEKRRKQEDLIKILHKLSECEMDTSKTREYALRLNDIYEPAFRHYYSDFFPEIVNIFKNGKDGLDYLAENIESIRKLVEDDYVTGKKEFNKLHDSFYKLSDHINLEISRILYYSTYEQKTEDSNKKLIHATKELTHASEELNHASEKAKSMQTELISVLSIFSAIVIAFSGGISFIGNTISASQSTYICKLILLILICGIIIFNTIFLLMYLVAKIVERNIYAKCLTPDCRCENPTCKCNGIQRIKKRLPYVFYFNSFAILFSIVDIIIWGLDKWFI